MSTYFSLMCLWVVCSWGDLGLAWWTYPRWGLHPHVSHLSWRRGILRLYPSEVVAEAKEDSSTFYVFSYAVSLYHVGQSKSHGQSLSMVRLWPLHGCVMLLHGSDNWAQYLKVPQCGRENVIFTKWNHFVGKNKNPQPKVSHNLFVISFFLSLISCSFLQLAPSPRMSSFSFLTWSIFIHPSSQHIHHPL